MSDYCNPKELDYGEAMSRIVRQFQCSRSDAYKKLQWFLDNKHFKLKSED